MHNGGLTGSVSGQLFYARISTLTLPSSARVYEATRICIYANTCSFLISVLLHHFVPQWLSALIHLMQASTSKELQVTMGTCSGECVFNRIYSMGKCCSVPNNSRPMALIASFPGLPNLPFLIACISSVFVYCKEVRKA